MAPSPKIIPSHEYQGFKVRAGLHQPIGATIIPGGINFSLISHHASHCTLFLYRKGEKEPAATIPFQGFFLNLRSGTKSWETFRIGKLFSMIVFDIDSDAIEYGFSLEASSLIKAEVDKPAIHRFDCSQILSDPYAKAIGGRDVWDKPFLSSSYVHRSRIIQEDYDWEGDRQLEIPMEELIIYEMHVRGFTRHPSSNVKKPGTFDAIHAKIPYLKELGINCVELMPIAEFDERENGRVDRKTGVPLLNYWGYSPIGFFAPKAGYASCGHFKDGTLVADELKTLIKELHRNGIEVILDVVFNHTAEGNEHGPTISFKGIDNAIYYMLTPEGHYYNFSGTGNTFNCNNPIVRDVILDCLRYWVAEYHIDGFRFDLAAILGRDPNGVPLANPPLLETLSFDPVLANCKLIAESWDAAGLYQVGSFPAYGRWAEWNGHYRDTMRKFVRGDLGQVSAVAQCLQGSPQLYASYHQTASVNFITCHDGFTLWDLVSYNEKHNLANDEDNRDGTNDNNSWNCGFEGLTADSAINALRIKQYKNFITILMLSRGVPMLLMGDEVGRSQFGNNNAWCQDNRKFWFDWQLLKKNRVLFRFVKGFIALRKRFASLFAQDVRYRWYTDWSHHAQSLSFMLEGKSLEGGHPGSCYLYVCLNMSNETLLQQLPHLTKPNHWHLFANTGMPSPEDIWPNGSEILIKDPSAFIVGPHSSCVLISKFS
jgi:glycogen operon protein